MMLFACSAQGPWSGRLENTVNVSPGTVPPRLCSSPQPVAATSDAAQTAASRGFRQGLDKTIATEAARF
jgi:hypothetical protein